MNPITHALTGWLLSALLVCSVGVSPGCSSESPRAPETVPAPRPVTGGWQIDDASHLNATVVRELRRPAVERDIIEAVKRAAEEGLSVAIAGARHSQGGHSFTKDGLVLDMRGFNRIRHVDREGRRVTVESGATWDQLQRALNPLGLAVLTQQSSNIFTVGGSMSSNIHGRDPQASLIAETVLGFRLLLPSGEVVNVDPDDELFRLVLGGYGLFGVILDVDLRVTDNRLLEKRARLMDYSELPAFFEETLRHSALFIARPSIAPSSLLRETAVTWWMATDRPLSLSQKALGEERNVRRDKAFFDLSRESDRGKELRWTLQKKLIAKPDAVEEVSRNNAMRPPTTPLLFLEYDSPDDTDIVQEYFVPKRSFLAFMDGARTILEAQEVNLLGLTIRYVEADTRIALPYAPEPSFAFMFYTNQGRDEAGQRAAQEMTWALVELALSLEGRHYLTYQTWPTKLQVLRGYPAFNKVIERKRALDPEERFVNGFYEAYGRLAADKDLGQGP